jgi:hypothetical protein
LFRSDRFHADTIHTAVSDFVTGRGKSLAYAGAAAALAGTGIGAVASAGSPAQAQAVATPARHASSSVETGLPSWVPAAGRAATTPATIAREADHAVSGHATGKAAPRKAGSHEAAAHKTAHKAAAHKTAGHKTARVHVVRRSHRPTTWKQIRDLVARQTYPRPEPGKLPLHDRVHVGSVSGPQAYLPITASRLANASTIVHRALAKHMGLRSAVIAVATSMQESTLDNISYGDRDSEGLFQQRPSAGWGTPAQITNPSYASDAFLNALRDHQRTDPSWASRPLWETAQAVQNSGFPYAYAKWESQAAQLVTSIARHMF